ncbi:GapS6b family protein [Marinomonas sp.]|uniref:GapS6b family protein n=1 Tax=Marinomonas sp. TaxID=1904862 RepID=UPI003F9E3D68
MEEQDYTFIGDDVEGGKTTNQSHTGSGDNVGGDKYEYIVRGIKSGDLMMVAATIMQDVCYRDPNKAHEKLNVLNGIGALEVEVQLLLKALKIKVELENRSDLPSKSDLLTLLKSDGLPNDICDLVTSILIDLESRSSVDLARKRYADLSFEGVYCKEIFYEFLASEEELKDNYQNAKVYNLSEQELTGLVRGALRVNNFEFAFEIAQCLHEYFCSSNSTALLLYVETCSLCSSNQQLHYISFNNKKKSDVDRLINQLISDISDKKDSRHIAALANLLNLTNFSDKRLFDLGTSYLDSIKKITPECSERIELLSGGIVSLKGEIDLANSFLNLEKFESLDIALNNNEIKVSDLRRWLEHGGEVRTDNDYMSSFGNLYLNAWGCSSDNDEIQRLNRKADDFLDLYEEKILQFYPHIIVRLCIKFIDLKLPLQAVKYLEPFLSDEVWVSPVLYCYLDALFASEKFDLLLSKISHLNPAEKTSYIYLREAQVYERFSDYLSSIASARATIEIEPNMPYAWQLLLHVSRENGASQEQLANIVREIPEIMFSSYHESVVPLVNEIATYADINFADKVLIDWFAQDPDKSAIALTQIHLNSLCNRPKVTSNPYEPLYCCDGVKYSDGFDSFSRLLIRDITSDHQLLLDIDSPLGQKLNSMQVGETLDGIKLLERLPSFVAAFRYAADIRNKGNDGTDCFKMFNVPSDENDFFPYFEKILRHFTPEERRSNEALNNPNLPLMMRAHYTDRGNPLRGAIVNLHSNDATQNMKLFNKGEEHFERIIVDVYTAVYLSMMGFIPSVIDLNCEIVLCRNTKRVLEKWLEDISKDDFMLMGVLKQGLHKTTSDSFKKEFYFLIEGIKSLLEISKLESLKPSDTPEFLIKIRDVVDETVFSTFLLFNFHLLMRFHCCV